jgi:F-type H+-transporting ATPase subunit delta
VHGSIVARSYAEALFELGERHHAHEAFVEGLDTIAALLAGEPQIRTFLETPKIDVQRKQQALRDALDDRVPPLLLNFVLVVLQKRRQRLLGTIAGRYRTLLDEKLGLLHADVTLAHEPDAALRQRIADDISRISGRTAVPRITVNPGILGGIIVRYGDRIIDGSLRRRLNNLRRRMVQSSLPAQTEAARGRAP